jgi:hypothetical protein
MYFSERHLLSCSNSSLVERPLAVQVAGVRIPASAGAILKDEDDLGQVSP